jgi:hypothetical protein
MVRTDRIDEVGRTPGEGGRRVLRRRAAGRAFDRDGRHRGPDGPDRERDEAGDDRRQQASEHPHGAASIAVFPSD